MTGPVRTLCLVALLVCLPLCWPAGHGGKGVIRKLMPVLIVLAVLAVLLSATKRRRLRGAAPKG